MAVFGIPSDKWGEAVYAVVVPVAGAAVTQQEVIDRCRTLIAYYNCPRSVEFRTEPLPLSGAGKVLKRARMAPDRRVQSVHLTKEGHKVIKTGLDISRHVDDIMMQGIDAKQKKGCP